MRRRFPGRHFLVGLGLALTALPTVASEGHLDYREHVMEAVGGHMQSAVDIIRQKVPYQDHLSMHVNALADLAAISDLLFPEGSEGGDALPAIWSQPDDFAVAIDNFKTAATGLKTAVDTGEGVGPAFQALGQSCKGCHDDYRAE